ncbi:MAG: ankyrin repeat domain-containing protein, partial [Novosphingobium sp.]|nr:ankyrin repeat domain-containing protein [Novosphingobium sp.]
MKKKHISLTLLSSIILQNNIFSMERNIEKGNNQNHNQNQNNQNSKINLLNLSNEMLLKIIQHIIESHIFNWNCITDWQIIKNEIIADLESIFLACTRLGKLKSLERYIINNINFLLKPKKDIFLKNRKIKTFKLFELLNKFYINKRDYKEVSNLIHSGADINIQSHIGNTILMHAVRHISNIDIVKLLISSGANINAKNNYSGNTALIWATKHGYKDIVELLITSGADVNAMNIYNNTPLILAAQKNYVEIVKLLI